MPVFVRALADSITLTAVRLDGGDIVLQEKGDRYTISDDAIDDNSIISAILKTAQEAGDVRIVIDKTRGVNYGELEDAINDQGNFSFFGEGDHSKEDIVALFTNDNGVSGTWTDVGVDLATNESSSSSPTVIFPNPSAANACFFIMSSERIDGMDIQIVQAKNGGDSAIIEAEYHNGSTWIAVPSMAYTRKDPFIRKWVDNSFVDVGTISVWFSRPARASQNTTTINGITAYAVRYRISSGTIAAADITASRFRLHSNSSGFTNTGGRVSWGQARRAEMVTVPLDNIPSANGPALADVVVSSNVTLRGYVEHPNTPDSHILGQTIIEPWMDTSSGIKPSLTWKAIALGGNVMLKLTVTKVRESDVEDGTLTSEVVLATETITGFVADGINHTLFDRVDIQEMQVRDILVFKLERLGATDTNTGVVHRRRFGIGVYRCLDGMVL